MCQNAHYISLKNLAGDKHSSLFCPAVIDDKVIKLITLTSYVNVNIIFFFTNCGIK